MNKEITFLINLEKIINERQKNPVDLSYTAQLFKAGKKRIAQKVGEEGVELAIAGATGSRDEIIDESADLLYHLLVLLADQKISLSDISKRLEGRNKKIKQNV
ncbi:MAG: phosphoribosyl-ATP diphosphatase [Gammaproteobacteria bacterium]|nr:phosphoribosyl-ATP diphosphatase [Gammaproteobacteria bacterium]|tara:strand:+ start:108 stop:416 length:309 start_codon:yes stop_codon:yes gene_type:complete